MGEEDQPALHFADTIRGGGYLADENAVRNLTEAAPDILRCLIALGVPFHMNHSVPILRNFGGQKKKRTAYARSSTGKIIMTALIQEARKYEAAGLIHRFPHHAFIRILTDKNACRGLRIQNAYTGEMTDYFGPVILCSGGLNGVFPGMTTGTSQNSGDVTAAVFAQGVRLGNPEMLQYHPTTIGNPGKRCLVTEAARGEGGRLYIERNGQPWYFIEEKYPELGNLMPRDVIAREMYFVRRQPECGDQVYLDLTGLSEEIWRNKLSDLREELIHYLGSDPKNTPIPVHGGNSMLGAIYGGKVAAETAAANAAVMQHEKDLPPQPFHGAEPFAVEAEPFLIRQISEILLEGLGIVRNGEQSQTALERLHQLTAQAEYPIPAKNRLLLAEAMLRAADARKESRGAHYRSDFPQTDSAYRKTTVVECSGGNVRVTFRNLPEVQA